jgi:hypothetical protein
LVEWSGTMSKTKTPLIRMDEGCFHYPKIVVGQYGERRAYALRECPRKRVAPTEGLRPPLAIVILLRDKSLLRARRL